MSAEKVSRTPNLSACRQVAAPPASRRRRSSAAPTWILTLPGELARVVAFDAELATAVFGVFADELGRWQRQRANALGIAQPQTGSLLEIQRFAVARGSLECPLRRTDARHRSYKVELEQTPAAPASSRPPCAAPTAPSSPSPAPSAPRAPPAPTPPPTARPAPRRADPRRARGRPVRLQSGGSLG